MNNVKAWERGEATWHLSFLHLYPITMMLGVIASFLTIAYFWKRQKYSWEILQILTIIVVPSAIFGARIWYLIATGSHWSFLGFFRFEGLAIQGGVMGALIGGGTFIWFRRHAVDIRTVIGIVMPAVLIGQAIGRWGNFDNHEVYGKIINDGESLNWLTFIKPHMYIHDTLGTHYRQPFFFYESMLNLLGYILIVWVVLRRNKLKPGVTIPMYLIWYGIVRLIMEPLRTETDIMKLGTFQVSTFMSAMWIVIGVALFIWFQVITNPGKIVKSFFSKMHDMFSKMQNKCKTKFGKWIASFGKRIFSSYPDKYERINPIKTRKVWYFGKKTDERKSKVFWGETVKHRVTIWIPNRDSNYSKRELNSRINAKDKKRKRNK